MTHRDASDDAPASGQSVAPIIHWQDVFVVVDQGVMHPSDYAEIERSGRELIARNPAGIAVLVIIPSVAKPPPEEVRKAISDLLARMGPHLRCACWLVEGSGFRAAAARGVLASLQMVVRSAYPTRVCSDLAAAVHWIVQHMPNGEQRMSTLPDAIHTIQAGRRRFAQ